MKKTILLITLIFMLTGCEAVYNLNIDGNSFKEEMILTTNDITAKNKKSVDVALKSNIPIIFENYKPEVNFKQNDFKYYTISKVETNNEIGVKYEAEFTKENYADSTIVKTHVPTFKLTESGNIMRLTVSKKRSIFENYPDLDKVTINITTNHKVTKQNADGVSGNTYTWTLTKDNYKTKEIYLNYSKELNTPQKEETKNYNIIFYVFGLGILAAIIYIVIKAKNTGK